MKQPAYKEYISEDSEDPNYLEKKMLKELQTVNLEDMYLVELQDEFLSQMKNQLENQHKQDLEEEVNEDGKFLTAEQKINQKIKEMKEKLVDEEKIDRYLIE